MASTEHINYKRIETAIAFIKSEFRQQPLLDDIAAAVNLSPFHFHFHRIFTEWAGVSPKKFIQYLSLEYAKDLLRSQESTLATAHKAGFSGTSRLHDLFVTIEGMTPGEFKNGGQGLYIDYSFSHSPFGKVLVASTSKGICRITFDDSESQAIAELKQQFPEASCRQRNNDFHIAALQFFQKDWGTLDNVKLHLAGTPFQIKVWESLLRIPQGHLSTYGNIAQDVGNPKACRAVGAAIGKNPIAFLIPCHRVIQGSGHIGGYRWNPTRKSAILGWEAALIQSAQD